MSLSRSMVALSNNDNRRSITIAWHKSKQTEVIYSLILRLVTFFFIGSMW